MTQLEDDGDVGPQRHEESAGDDQAAKEAIKQQLLSEKKTKEMREWIEGLKDEFDVAYQVGYEPPKTTTGATTQTGSWAKAGSPGA